MSDSEDSTITYTESDPEEDPEKDGEDPEEDPANYPTDGDDDDDDEEEEESSRDEANDEEEDEDEDEHEEEDEHPAPCDSIPPPPVHRTTTRVSIPVQAPIPFSSEVEIDRLPSPLPSPLSPWSSPLPRFPHHHYQY
nr:hypothetical protein [Tanacetum cinerariifolium]